jgi:hypothetical protein
MIRLLGARKDGKRVLIKNIEEGRRDRWDGRYQLGSI